MTPLDDLMSDRNQTPLEFDAKDFVARAHFSLQDAKDATYGFAWEAGAMITGAARAADARSAPSRDSRTIAASAPTLR
jgi:multiple sugar transport system substrate-binding protein